MMIMRVMISITFIILHLMSMVGTSTNKEVTSSSMKTSDGMLSKSSPSIGCTLRNILANLLPNDVNSTSENKVSGKMTFNQVCIFCV